jgi:hypothetical protein
MKDMQNCAVPVTFMDKQWNDNSFLIPCIEATARSYAKYMKSWKQIAIIIAFYRANSTHPFRNSIISLTHFMNHHQWI